MIVIVPSPLSVIERSLLIVFGWMSVAVSPVAWSVKTWTTDVFSTK